MAILFRCECGKKYKAPEDKIGRIRKCSQCGQSITVPQRSTETMDVPQPKEDNQLAMSAGVLSLFLSIVGTLLFFFSRGSVQSSDVAISVWAVGGGVMTFSILLGIFSVIKKDGIEAGLLAIVITIIAGVVSEI